MRGQSELAAHPTLAGERVLAILGPGAIDLLPLLKQHLSKVFPHLDVIAPRDLSHLDHVIKHNAETHSVVIAVGGDGTLHRVLNAADLTKQALGIIPSGTGNDLVRELGVPRQLTPAIAFLSRAVPRPTDYGLANGIRYHNSGGFGIDSATLYLRETRRNALTRNYNIAFLMALARMKCPPLKIDVDDEHFEGQFYWSLAMNSPYIGGGTRIAPRASLDDGLLDVLLVRETGKLAMVRQMLAAIKGRHLSLPFVVYRQARGMVCRCAEPIPYLALDGELHLLGEREVRIEVRPGGMRFLR